MSSKELDFPHQALLPIPYSSPQSTKTKHSQRPGSQRAPHQRALAGGRRNQMPRRPGSRPQTPMKPWPTPNSLFISPPRHICKRSVAPASSPCPHFHCRDKHVELPRNTTPRKPKGQQRLWLILLGEERAPPRPGGRFSEADLLEAPTPLHTSPRCLGQKWPVTQVSSCCNKLLLTQDYGSFQIPPREQGNKHSLPGLGRVVSPVGNPCLYLLLLQAFVWEVCWTIPAHSPFRRKLNVSIVH